MVINNNISILELDIKDNIENTKPNKKELNQDIYNGIKRMLDIICSIIGCILLIPITIFVFILNLCFKNNGPIFFTQKRIGKDGKIFKMYKYRTMVVNAEEILEREINKGTAIAKEYLENKKIKEDPRITKIGRFLRNTSLDEFPQFINVLKGEMTLVGPRPYLEREKEDMGEYYATVIKMKPGITGPWQVAGRNNLNFKGRLQLDEEYDKKKNIIYDIRIIFKTIVKTIKKDGAM